MPCCLKITTCQIPTPYTAIGFYDVEIYVNAKIEDVRAYALFIAQYGELGAQLISLSFGNLAEAKRFVDEGYLGSYKNRSAFDCNEDYLAQIPEHLRFCVKYKIRRSFCDETGFSCRCRR